MFIVGGIKFAVRRKAFGNIQSIQLWTNAAFFKTIKYNQ